ncbi:response regulator transcription factor [Rhizobium sp. TH2]|uniref:helix-turn-helix domain-containing protein n=1 Tax=Rhizobium sp. TH2 TaxID=2775403 RepID=UPI0021573783|nr:LuxR C-terminal-related transcriptional regulator [Rhizobium sp. TH2]UVC08031.1 response regulator transcription factor [Rhizobium sp. TH2]
MGLGIASFSRFITEMNHEASHMRAEELARWAVTELSVALGFDAAWYGWARLHPAGVDVFANATHQLPDDFFTTWQRMADQDLLARSKIEHPRHAAIYSRKQRQQTDGMADLSDRYGLTRMTTAMENPSGGLPNFYLSSYRVGNRAKSWSPEECEFLQCAVSHLTAAMKLSTAEPGRAAVPGSVTILASRDGIGFLCLDALREQFGDVWPRWTGDNLPEQLASLIGHPGTHVLTDRNLVVSVETTPGFEDMDLRRLTLRRLNRFDLLTRREREVARELAGGKSAKEVARHLGLAPATVRNQTQSIYQKLEVDNRAALVAAVPAGTG